MCQAYIESATALSDNWNVDITDKSTNTLLTTSTSHRWYSVTPTKLLALKYITIKKATISLTMMSCSYLIN